MRRWAAVCLRTARRRTLKTYSVKGSGHRCFAEVKTARHSVRTDTPKLQGGTDLAAEPVETLLAALIGCEQATAHFVARMLRMSVDRIEFDIHAARDPNGSMARPLTDEEPPVPVQLQAVWGSAWVYSSSPTLTAEDVSRLGRIVHKRCPVAAMIVASGCDLRVVWHLHHENGDAQNAS